MARSGVVSFFKVHVLFLVFVLWATVCLAGTRTASRMGYKRILTRSDVEADPIMATKMKLFEERLVTDPPTKILVDGEVVMCVKLSNQLSLMGESNLPLLLEPLAPPLESDDSMRSSDNVDLIEMATTRPLEYESKQICPSGTYPYRPSPLAEAADVADAHADAAADARNAEPAVAVGSDGVVHEYVHAVMDVENQGMKMVMSIYQPQVEPFEFSLGQLWLAALDGTTNTIEIGWQVYEALYGDDKPHLFVYWTADGYGSTGCYNLQCPGFVQTSNTKVVGSALSPVSQIGGSQYVMTVLVHKDIPSNRWWLNIDNENVGYWPGTLFSNSLKDKSSQVDCGGEIVNYNAPDPTSTQMGSGELPQAGYGRSAFIRNIEYVDMTNTLRSASVLDVYETRPGCYEAAPNRDASWGSNFFFGGPGSNNANCN